MTESHIRNVIEAALLAAGKPLQPAELVELFDEGSERPAVSAVQAILITLAEEYSTRGIEIKETAAGFRIQVRRELANEISRLWPERPARYSRALLETLALIAYRQPITRAEIEAVRGVAVNPNILKTVIERNWVRVVGHRDVPGRPELLGTTRDFLDYFGLRSLDELPPLAELKAISEIKVQFDLPDPGPLALEANGDPVGSEASGAAAGSDANGDTVAGDPTAALAADGSASTEGGAGENASREGGADAGVVATAVESSSAESDSATAFATDGMPVADVDAGANAAGTTSETTDAESGGEVTENQAPHDSAAATGATSDAVASDADTAVSASDSGPSATVDATDAKGADAPGDGDSSTAAPTEASAPQGRGAGRKKKHGKGGKARAPDTALHEAEEFAASVDADLAAGDDDNSDEDELSAAGPDSSELVAGPRDIDD